MSVKFVQEWWVVKAFIIHKSQKEELLRARARAVDELTKLQGELVFEISIKKDNLLLVVAFEEESMFQVWTAITSPVILNPVKNCQVLSIKGENINLAAEQTEEIQKSVRRYEGIVLKMKCWSIPENEYRMLVYFSEKRNMEKWKKELSL